MVALLGTGGCVSQMVGSLDEPYGPVEVASLTTSESPLSAPDSDSAPGTEAAAIPEGSATDTVALNAGENRDLADPTDIPAATVFPEPAPRDGAGNPRLAQGAVLAFGESDAGTDSAADSVGAIASASPLSGTSESRRADAASIGSQPVAASAAGTGARQNSLFAALFTRWKSRQATAHDANVRTASLAPMGPSPSNPVGTASEAQGDGSQIALPGVSNKARLFEVEEGGHDEGDEQVELASTGAFARTSPNGLRLQTERVHAECLKPGLVAILKTAERHFGRPVIVTSGFRNPKDNKRAGGARKSLHMQCAAADIQIDGVSKWDLASYLRTVPGRGGVGTYCRTRSVHIDIGEERAWHYPCRRTARRKS